MKKQYPHTSRHEIARKIRVMRRGNYRSHTIGTYFGRWDKPDRPEYVLRYRNDIIIQPNAFRGCYTIAEAKRARLCLALRNEKVALKCLKQGHEVVCI